jgi:hypothetical protein
MSNELNELAILLAMADEPETNILNLWATISKLPCIKQTSIFYQPKWIDEPKVGPIHFTATIDFSVHGGDWQHFTFGCLDIIEAMRYVMANMLEKLLEGQHERFN